MIKMKTNASIVFNILIIGLLVLSSSCSKDDPLNIVVDIQGNVYKIVTIGDQTWMAENLKYLPEVVGPATGSQTIPYYYVYGYDGKDVNTAKATDNYKNYGVLYNWPAAMAGTASSSANSSKVQGVCPNGWHLPSDAEWKQLTDYLLGANKAADQLKEAGNVHWNKPNTGTNESGFTALPGGYRNSSGAFDHFGYVGYWWSATEANPSHPWYRDMTYNASIVYRGSTKEESGFSVRCVKD